MQGMGGVKVVRGGKKYSVSLSLNAGSLSVCLSTRSRDPEPAFNRRRRGWATPRAEYWVSCRAEPWPSRAEHRQQSRVCLDAQSQHYYGLHI